MDEEIEQDPLYFKGYVRAATHVHLRDEPMRVGRGADKMSTPFNLFFGGSGKKKLNKYVICVPRSNLQRRRGQEIL